MTKEKKIELIQQIINHELPVYIFGTNEYADAIAARIHVDGFINDITDELHHHGINIIKLSDLPPKSIVISCVVLAKPIFAISKIQEKVESVLDYYFFKKYSGLDLPEVIFNNDENFVDEYNNHREFYNELREKLNDETSKITLDNIINFRVKSDIKYLYDFVYNPVGQYFDPIVEFNDNEVFLDVGCFDGYTSLQFAKHASKFDKIYAFEPDLENMKRVRANLEELQNKVEFFNIGLSDREMTLRFDSSGSSSKISTSGTSEIKVKQLDTLKIENVSYIKMDIEGAELNALKGAVQTIKSCHPKLAISVYHKVDDLRKIPEFVLSIRNDYNIYLRHYTEGVTETVMYFIPIN